MIYVDTSCLIKIFRVETHSRDVLMALAAETQVIVSTLTEVETLVQLKAIWKSGEFTRPQWQKQEAEFAQFREQPPFEFRPLSATVFQTAVRQHRNSGGLHCRSLDRLHLAAVEELVVNRLMTHDEAQARAAEAVGFSVIRPGRR